MVEVNRRELSKALKKLSKTADHKGSIPVLACVLVEVEGKRLRLTTTNLEQVGWVELELNKSYPKTSFTAEIKKLEKIVNCTQSNLIALVSEGDKLKVKTSTTEFSLPSLFPPEEFPTIEKSYTPLLEIDKEFFVNALTRLMPFAHADEERGVLNAVNVELRKEAIYFVATNGYCLASLKIEWDEPPETSNSFNIPRKTIPLIKAFAGKNEGTVEIGVNEEKVIIKSSNNYLGWSPCEGEFPQWEVIIPEKLPYKATFNRRELLRILKEMSIIPDNAVRLTITPKELQVEVRAVTSDGEEKAYSRLRSASNLKEPLTIGFSQEHLFAVLESFSAEKIEIGIAEPISPVLFTSPEEPEFKVVAMPLKLN